MLRAWFAILLLVAISGCNSGNGIGGSHETSTTSSTAATSGNGSSTSTTSTTLPLPELPFGLILNDCRGIRSAYRFVGEGPTGPEIPPGWESDGPSPTIIHDILILECGRLSLGAFERGPIHVLVESHTNANIPTECLDYSPATNTGLILRGIWFDDAEVATFLAKNWAMPIHVGNFTFAETTQQGLSVFEWTWAEPGSGTSSLRYGRTETTEGGNPDSRRYFWHDETSAYMLDMMMDDRQPLVTPPAAIGSLSPPMTPIDPYAGVFSLVDPGAAYTGTLHHFRDLKCSDS